MFIHTLNTWLLAHLLHPFLFLGFAFLRFENGNNTIDEEGLNFLFIFWVISFFISIPSLILSTLLLYPLSNLRLSSYEKWILWFITITISVGINFLGLLLVLGEGLLIGNFIYMLPSIFAALISILVRIKPFLKLQLNYKNK